MTIQPLTNVPTSDPTPPDATPPDATPPDATRGDLSGTTGASPVWDAWATAADPSQSPGTSPDPSTLRHEPAGEPTGRAAPADRTAWPAPPPNPSPTWARWALAGLLGLTAALYLWSLDSNGWANSYYSAAAQAAGQSWTAWFFGGLDAANSITVDKPPASLWLMGASVRLFGLSPWSVLVPQALLGVATVGVLYATVRRWFGAPAGLIAGAVMALTPVATLMFRFNNPDALLVFLLVCAAWAMGRATERGSLRWIAMAGGFVGLAFLAKMMQAFLVLPGFVAMYALAAPISWRRRLGHLLGALAAMLLSAGWWVAVVEIWPASARPYIGGSQANSVIELILGYNGFGRLTGNETGSVVPGGAGGGAQGGMWGETGWDRLLTASYGGQIAWLLPAALAMLIVALWVSRRSARTDLTRAAALGWGGWLLVTAAVISFSAGIIHEYYTVALAPAIGALVGIGTIALWAQRGQPWARITAAAVIAGSAWWAATLLGRSTGFLPWLDTLVVAGAMAAATLIIVAPRLPAGTRRVAAATAGASALLVLLAGPAAYSLQTAGSSAGGSLPSAGPAVAGARGGPGGARGGVPDGGGAPHGGPAQGGQAQGGFPGGTPPNGGLPGGTPPDGGAAGGPPALGGGQAAAPDGTAGADGATTLPDGAATLPDGAPGGAGSAGSLLHGSTPGAALTAALLEDADSFTWVAASVGANSAAGYQLATQRPVMAIGGFNGSDPSPTLGQFQQYVAEGRIHWFIAGGGAGRGGQLGGSQASSQITAWVQATFTATTIDGVTAYDLSGPATTTSTAQGTSTA